MALPYFFTESIDDNSQTLDEESSRHIVQVLRMKEGELVMLTDGNGNTAEVEITDAHKKHCSVKIVRKEFVPRPSRQLTIAISLVKNASRFEWFLEKATELGTAEIIPMICERTERQKFKADRFQNILRSAMLQSMQIWLPLLHEPQSFREVVNFAQHDQRFIAHCLDRDKQSLHTLFDPLFSSHIVLIGPEGDFTNEEITHAIENGFAAVSLGSNRLRTETAGIFAAVIAGE